MKHILNNISQEEKQRITANLTHIENAINPTLRATEQSFKTNLKKIIKTAIY